MHEIKGKQHTGKSGGGDVSGQLSGKEIDQGNHSNAKERADDAPAEGIHAEQQYAEGDQEFAKRWMRVFVSGQPVKKFIGGARVIDLVEVHTVSEGAYARIKRCLIKQRGIICGIDRGNDLSVLIQKDQFEQRGGGAFQCQLQVVCCAVQL